MQGSCVMVVMMLLVATATAEHLSFSRSEALKKWPESERNDWSSKRTSSDMDGANVSFKYEKPYTSDSGDIMFGNSNTGVGPDRFFWHEQSSRLYAASQVVVLYPVVNRDLPSLSITGTFRVCSKAAGPGKFQWVILEHDDDGNVVKTLASGEGSKRSPSSVDGRLETFTSGTVTVQVNANTQASEDDFAVCDDQVRYTFASTAHELPKHKESGGGFLGLKPVVDKAIDAGAAIAREGMDILHHLDINLDEKPEPATLKHHQGMHSHHGRSIHVGSISLTEVHTGSGTKIKVVDHSKKSCTAKGFSRPMNKDGKLLGCCPPIAPPAGWNSCIGQESSLCNNYCKTPSFSEIHVPCKKHMALLDLMEQHGQNPADGTEDAMKKLCEGAAGRVEYATKMANMQAALAGHNAPTNSNGLSFGVDGEPIRAECKSPSFSYLYVTKSATPTPMCCPNTPPPGGWATCDGKESSWCDGYCERASCIFPFRGIECDELIWDYEDRGPTTWGSIDKHFVMCDKGSHQSPIDLDSSGLEIDMVNTPKITARYNYSPIDVLINKWTVQLNFKGAGGITVDGKYYMLENAHFHTPSEHTLSGVATDAELQFVHGNKEIKGRTIISVLLTVGDAAGTAMNQITRALPKKIGLSANVLNAINPSNLMPKDWEVESMYYDGSISTPPCSENTHIFVAQRTVPISEEGLKAIKEALGGIQNVRPTQPVGHRRVTTRRIADSGVVGGGRARYNSEWRYSGLEGPYGWFSLDPKFILCRMGRHQSPINIHEATSASIPPNGMQLTYNQNEAAIVTQYVNTTGHVSLNKKSGWVPYFMINFSPGSFIKLERRLEYSLVQAHVHIPGEHTIDGVAPPMEMQLVHENPEGKVIISVGFKEGKANAVIQKILDSLPDSVVDALKPADFPKSDMFNPVDLLPDDPNFWMYDGSITTPPCTEGVRWIVMKQLIEISSEQTNKIYNLMGSIVNARPVQVLHDRLVVTTSFPPMGMMQLPGWNDHIQKE